MLATNDKPAHEACPVSRGMRRAFDEIADEVEGAVSRVLKARTLQDVIDSL